MLNNTQTYKLISDESFHILTSVDPDLSDSGTPHIDNGCIWTTVYQQDSNRTNVLNVILQPEVFASHVAVYSTDDDGLVLEEVIIIGYHLGERKFHI